MRQIYPLSQPGAVPSPPGELDDAALAALYAYPTVPDRDGWLRANMVASVDGAATLRGRSGGLSGGADRRVFALQRALADIILVGASTVRVEGYQPIRPGREGQEWAWLREGRPPAAAIAVLTRRLDLDPASPLLAGSPGQAQTIVITTSAAPAGLRREVARNARVIVAGTDSVDLPAAVTALAGLGHRHLLTEGGPHLLDQVVAAGLLRDLCLTLSPLLAGPAAGRIVRRAHELSAPAPAPGEHPAPLTLAHVIEDEGHLLCRYVAGRSRPAGA